MEKQELKINAQPATIEVFRLVYYASGLKSYDELLLDMMAVFAEKKQLDLTVKIPPDEQEPETATPVLSKFQFLAVIERNIHRPVIEATDEQAAREALKEKHPHATIHECKKIL
jgi:hypothetical protein